MKIYKFTLTSTDKDKLYTEISYDVASAKIEGGEIALLIPEMRRDTITETLEKIFKQLKKLAAIDFYVKSSEISTSTAGSYLINKYPEIEGLDSENECYIIKL